MQSVNEKGSFYESVTFYNSVDSRFTPSSADYNIYDLTTNTEIKAWTAITPASTVSIPVTETETRMVNEYNPVEYREMNIRFTDDQGNQQMVVRHFKVINRGGVAS